MRTRIYIAPFDDNGNLSKDGNGDIDNWTEITEDVDTRSIGATNKNVDRNDIEIGLVNVSSFSIKVSNLEGKYSEVPVSTSLFKFSRKGTPVKIEFDQADHEPHYNIQDYNSLILSTDTEIFRGFIDDSSTKMGLQAHVLTFAVIGRETLVDQVLTPALAGGVDTVKTAVFAILDQTKITDHVTVTLANINPSNNPILDDVTGYVDETGKESLEELLLIGNSILYIDEDSNFILRDRTPTSNSLETFVGPSSELNIQNLININNIDPGTDQVINFVTVKGTSVSVSDATSISKFGIKKLEIDIPSITDTTKRTTVATSIVSFFATEARRFVVRMPMTADRIKYALMSVLKVDSPPLIIDTSTQAFYEVSDYDVGTYAEELTSFSVDTSESYALIGAKLQSSNTKFYIDFKLRRI